MAEKRKRDAGGDHERQRNDKKQKRGFQVGPANLPDGIYKRKNEKIKNALIERAHIKKKYDKLKKHGDVPQEQERIPQPASMVAEGEEEIEPTTAPHADRQALIERQAEDPERSQESKARDRPRKQRKPKAVPFKREYNEAQQRKVEAEERRRAREEADMERQKKYEDRERFRRAMAKARSGGPGGQRKLGRESKVLLEKVKRMVGDAG